MDECEGPKKAEQEESGYESDSFGSGFVRSGLEEDKYTDNRCILSYLAIKSQMLTHLYIQTTRNMTLKKHDTTKVYPRFS